MRRIMEGDWANARAPRRSLTPAVIDRSELAISVESMLVGLDAWNAHLDRLDRLGRDLALLDHAVSTVPFYQRLPGPAAGWTWLDELPIVSRDQVAESPDEFVSRALAERFIAKTSGTTSTPLTGIFDQAAWYDLTQDVYARVFEAIPELHGTARSGAPAVTLVCNELNRPNTSVLLVPLAGAVFRRRVLGRGRASDEAVIDELRDSGCPLLYGKANYLLDLRRAERLRGSAERARPRAILVSGEKLFEDDRARLEDWFGCRVYDAYVSVEGGLIALGCATTRALHVQSDRVALGVFNGRDSEPTGDGELVLTSYTNFAMPFIRYRTGDGAVLADRCACGHVGPTIMEMRGREAAWLDLPDRRVRAGSLDRVLVRPEVEAFELVQLAPGRFRLSWVAARDGTPDAPGASVGRALDQALAAALPGASAEVVQVASVVKPGGKARR
jgi:phenylacetate-coenzyme A ligase PaaK-like adenylate-forming protein